MANCIKIARRKLCQRMIAKSRIIRKKCRITIPKPSKMKSRIIWKNVGLSSQNHQKLSPNLPKMTQKSMPKLGSRKSRKKWRLGFLPVYSFWSKIRPKFSKLRFVQDFGIQKGIRKSMPKKYGKSMPKGSQNETKMDAKTSNCSYFFKKGENGRNYLFYNIKPGSC